MPSKGQLRIIGGRWKRRQIRFPDIPGLRPSPDAVRETLFNWLQGDLSGRHCLDLFAGSGVLGFEAVSRGAESAVLVDRDKLAAQALRQACELLDASQWISVVHSDAMHYLEHCDHTFELVFLDPPFGRFDLEKLCRRLVESDVLAEQALVYIESPRTGTPLPVPDDWHIIRETSRGMVQSTLLEV